MVKVSIPVSLLHLQYCKRCCFFTFVATAITVFCVQLVKQLFLYIYKEVSGAFYIFLIIYVTWFCFSKKIACGHPFHYLLIKMFYILCTNRQGLPVNFVNLIFSVLFYVALKSLCISNVLTFFFINHVLINFAKLTENT